MKRGNVYTNPKAFYTCFRPQLLGINTRTVYAIIVRHVCVLIDKDPTKHTLQKIIEWSCGSEDKLESPKKHEI